MLAWPCQTALIRASRSTRYLSACRTRASLNGFSALFMVSGWNPGLFTETTDTPGVCRAGMYDAGTSNIAWTEPPVRAATWAAIAGMLTSHSSSRYGRPGSQ